MLPIPVRSVASVRVKGSELNTENRQFEVFFDGQCPLCRREIEWLRKRDRQNRIRFTDFTSADFDWDSVDKSHDELVSQIHGRDNAGKWVQRSPPTQSSGKRTGRAELAVRARYVG